MINYQISQSVLEAVYACIIFLTSLFVGINRSFLAFLFHQLDSPDTLIRVNDEQKSWIACLSTIPCPLGCLLSGVLIDVFGRKQNIQLVYVPLLISWLLFSVANKVWILYVVVFIQGIGIGMSFCTSTYIAELARAKYRATLLAAVQIFINFGILLTSLLMYNFHWTTVTLTLAALSVLCYILSFLLPESPTWLYLKGRKAEAIKILNTLRCEKSNPNGITLELEDMEKFCLQKQNTTFRNTLRLCLSSWRPLMIVSAAFILSINTGFTLFLMFTIMIVDRLHMPLESTKITVAFSAAGLLGSMLTPIFVHKCKKKTVLSVSSIGMGLSMLIISMYEENFTTSYVQVFDWIMPYVLYFYNFSATLGVVPLGFIIGGEFFPNEVRGVLNGVYGTIAYTYWAALNKFYPHFLSVYGVKTSLWVFSVSSFILAGYVIFILPETKGKTLNEIQEKHFKKKKTIS